MQQATPHRAFAATVAWTLALLLLGSVVHATESSLACPDWPTCYGTMVPEMEGGVFWEHLHRLVAGGLILLFGLATWLSAKQGEPRPVVWACWAGVGLLVVQSIFGGLTVILLLPDAISTTHLGLAFLFLGLATVLATVTSPRRGTRPRPTPEARRLLRRVGAAATALVFVQSLLGAAVRHSDAGMACGRGMLCNGGLLPPAWTLEVGVHWLHRFVGVVALGVVLGFAVALLRRDVPAHVRRAAWYAAALVILQVALGFLSAWTLLAVAPVSLHTLVAASLLAVLVVMTTWGHMEARGRHEAGAGPAAGGDSAAGGAAARDGRPAATGAPST